jgi:hypothetical protein
VGRTRRGRLTDVSESAYGVLVTCHPILVSVATVGQSGHTGCRRAQESGSFRRNHDQQTDHEDPGRRSGGHDRRRADRRRVGGVRRYSRYRHLAIDRSACVHGGRAIGAVALS